MSTILFRLLFFISFSSLFVQVNAQVRGNVNFQSQSAPSCVTVYDCDMVDEQPEFPGGESAMVRFINETREYPSEAYSQHIEGRVVCSFVVNEDGSLSYISVLKGVEESLNREAVRIISQMPRWIAGKLNGSRVPVYYIVPIPFRL